MMVYTWEGIPVEDLKKEYDLYLRPNSPKASPYYNQDLVVNMKYNGVDSFLQNRTTTNKQGWSRNKYEYWKEMLEKHPNAFDDVSKNAIMNKESPTVTQQFIDYFGLEEYKPYMGQTLIHHHIGQDGQAVAVPQGMHYGGETSAIHRIESNIGVTGNAEMHSQKVQEALNAGYIQSGDDVWSSLNNAEELGTKSATKFEYIQELQDNKSLLNNFSEWDTYSGDNKKLFELKQLEHSTRDARKAIESGTDTFDDFAKVSKNADFAKYLSNQGYLDDVALSSKYADFDSLTDAQKMQARYSDRVFKMMGIDDLNAVSTNKNLASYLSSVAENPNGFDNVRVDIDTNGKITNVDLSGGNISLDDYPNSMSASDYRAASAIPDDKVRAVDPNFDSYTEKEKLLSKMQFEKGNDVLDELRKVDVSSDDIAEYARKAGKTVDSLTDADMDNIRVGKWAKNIDDIPVGVIEDFSKLRKTNKLLKAVPYIGAVFVAIDALLVINDTVSAYNEHGLDDAVLTFTEGAAKIATDFAVDALGAIPYVGPVIAVIDLISGGAITVAAENIVVGIIERVSGRLIEGTQWDDIGAFALKGNNYANIIFGDSGNDEIYGYEDGDNLYGEDGDDTIYGGTGSDIIYGDADYDDWNKEVNVDTDYTGDDKIYGESGTDYIYGGAGGDYIEGGADDDYLFGEAGTDTIYGNGETDYIEGGTDNDDIHGGEGDDIIYGGIRDAESEEGFSDKNFVSGDDEIYGDEGNDVIFGGDGNDTISGGSDIDFIYGEEGMDTLDGDDGTDHIEGGDDNDIINGGADGDELFGNDGDDTIHGDSGDDYIESGNGDNLLYGDDGNDTIVTGEDTDHAFGGSGNDYVIGGNGANYMYGEDGDDRLQGGEGYDYMEGGLGVDNLSGGNGYNEMYGQEGNDFIYGGDHADYIDGGVGDDQLYGANATDGQNEIYGREGNDIIYDGDQGAYIEGNEGDDYIFAGGGNDRIDAGVGNDYIQDDHGDDTIVFKAGYGTDIVSDAAGNNTIELSGLSIDDATVYRDGGDLILSFSTGDSLVIKQYFDGAGFQNFSVGGTKLGDLITDIHGTYNDDWMSGSNDGGALYGGYGNDNLNGGNSNDQLYGETGNDNLYGNDGDDILDGADGNDYLSGGNGNDIYIFGKGYGNDSIDDWGGSSTVSFKDLNADDITVSQQYDANLIISVNGTSDVLTINGYKWNQGGYTFEFADGTTGTVNKETWELELDSDTPAEGGTSDSGSENNNTDNSGTGDVTTGDTTTDSPDTGDSSTGDATGEGEITQPDVNVTDGYVVNGTENNDGWLSAPNNNDGVIDGGNGDDSLNGGSGSDKLYGGAGYDKLYGNDGDDVLDGGIGSDELNGGNGTDTYIFAKGYGNDIINEWSNDVSVIKFTDINSDEVTLNNQSETNLILSVNGTSDSLTINNYRWSQGSFNMEFADGTVGTVNKETWEMEYSQSPAATADYDISEIASEEELVQSNADLLAEIYTEDTAVSEELVVETDETVISDIANATTVSEETDEVSAQTDVQVMILTENMSAFANENNVSDSTNIIDSAMDASALNQLLVGTSIQ